MRLTIFSCLTSSSYACGLLFEHDRNFSVLKQDFYAWLVQCKKREVKNLVGPAGKAAIVHHSREKKDDKKDNEVIEHKGAAVVAHRRRK
jgi:hypothetical protein